MEPVGRMLADAMQDVDQVVIRVDLVQPTGDNQALHDPDVFGTEFGPAEQPVLAIMPSLVVLEKNNEPFKLPWTLE